MNFEIKKVGKSKAFPAKVVIFGVPKIGKSRFASNAEGAFFIDAEGGLDYLDKETLSTPTLKNFDDVVGWLNHLLKKETDTSNIKTVIIDSFDWVEKYAQEKITKAYNAASIYDPRVKDFAYHKGVLMAAEEAWRVITLLNLLWDQKQIRAIILCHSTVREMDLPGKDNYSKHVLKLSKHLGAKLNEWADLILFADYDFHVDKDGKVSEQKAMLFTCGDASFEGGGRMLLKNKIPLDFAELEKQLAG